MGIERDKFLLFCQDLIISTGKNSLFNLSCLNKPYFKEQNLTCT